MSVFGSRSSDFTISGVAGQGAYGTAYIVRCTANGSEKVLKVVDLSKLSKCKGSDSADEKRKKMVLQQAQLMKEFVRANDISSDCHRIVRVEDAWYDEPNFYIMMEFCHGGTLHTPWEEVYDQLQNGDIVVREDVNENPFVVHGELSATFGGDLPVNKIFIQISEALVFLERKSVVHLDLKPDNVFINQNGDLKIGDFGLCKSVTTKKGAVSTIQGNSYGTEGFMAPEIVKGQAVTTKADVYSFGVIIFSCVMLRGAEKTDPLPLRINEGLWPNHGNRAALVQRMLAENPASRPLASEIHAALTVSQLSPPSD